MVQPQFEQRDLRRRGSIAQDVSYEIRIVESFTRGQIRDQVQAVKEGRFPDNAVHAW